VFDRDEFAATLFTEEDEPDNGCNSSSGFVRGWS